MSKLPINKIQAIEIVKDFLDEEIVSESWYQAVKPGLKAIILYGSVAKGTNRADSDLDLLFIMPLEIEEKETAGEYFYKYEDHEINIVIRSTEGLKQIAAGVHDDFQAEIFREAEIIWQKDEEVKELIERIKGVA